LFVCFSRCLSSSSISSSWLKIVRMRFSIMLWITVTLQIVFPHSVVYWCGHPADRVNPEGWPVRFVATPKSHRGLGSFDHNGACQRPLVSGSPAVQFLSLGLAILKAWQGSQLSGLLRQTSHCVVAINQK
jgi:hypothetical protein